MVEESGTAEDIGEIRRQTKPGDKGWCSYQTGTTSLQASRKEGLAQATRPGKEPDTWWALRK